MIRRSFWLAAGAFLGVAGYRRVTRTAKALRPPMVRTGRGAAGRGGTETIAFVRDVRAGMADYLDRRRET